MTVSVTLTLCQCVSVVNCLSLGFGVCESTSIGAFTVTSFAVSPGRLESLVGKTFVAGGLCVHFAGILSLFAFILLTQKIMIMFCVGAGYIGYCVDGSFYFCNIRKKEKRGKLWLKKLECVQL